MASLLSRAPSWAQPRSEASPQDRQSQEQAGVTLANSSQPDVPHHQHSPRAASLASLQNLDQPRFLSRQEFQAAKAAHLRIHLPQASPQLSSGRDPDPASLEVLGQLCPQTLVAREVASTSTLTIDCDADYPAYIPRRLSEPPWFPGTPLEAYSPVKPPSRAATHQRQSFNDNTSTGGWEQASAEACAARTLRRPARSSWEEPYARRDLFPHHSTELRSRRRSQEYTKASDDISRIWGPNDGAPFARKLQRVDPGESSTSSGGQSDDVGLHLLMSRLRLYQAQRQMAAMHCARFTAALEAAYPHKGQGIGQGLPEDLLQLPACGSAEAPKGCMDENEVSLQCDSLKLGIELRPLEMEVETGAEAGDERESEEDKEEDWSPPLSRGVPLFCHNAGAGRCQMGAK